MYITLYKKTNPNTNSTVDYANLMQNPVQYVPIEYYKTTIHVPNPNPREELKHSAQVAIATAELCIKNAWEILKPFEHNYEEQYYEFQIPKRSGGLRTINAPNEDFKTALTAVKIIFEKNLKCLAHNSAYAYTKNRSTLDAISVHQKNQSNWYLKIDLKDFFPSCTPELIFIQLKKLYPFYYFSERTDTYLKNIIKICCLKNGLPQGTPMSPLLTNLIMVPYDYIIQNYLKRGTSEHYAYTRYADDLLISSKSAFDWRVLENTLKEILAPFQINHNKTRYGSKAGSNWNLGLMLNKDNNITLGSNKKKILNAMLNNFIKDFKNGTLWSREDAQCLQGHLSYLNQIEPTYYTHLITKYQNKYNIADYKTLIKTILN